MPISTDRRRCGSTANVPRHILVCQRLHGGYDYGFYKAGWGEWGGKMQDDVTDATRWAITKGIADPSVSAFSAAATVAMRHWKAW